MSTLNNQDNIQAWSAYSHTMIEAVGEEGDPARQYILNPIMQNCIHVLKPGGQFIFSLLHPCFDEVDQPDVAKGYRAKGYIRVDEYLHEFVIQQPPVGYYIHRPLSVYLNLVIDAGCTIRKVIEPTLTPEGVAVLGEQDRNLHIPNFIVISAAKG